jgi:RNA-directed DNA polymerase
VAQSTAGVRAPTLAATRSHACIKNAGPATGKVAAAKRRHYGLPNYRLVRFANDWCLVVHGTQADAVELGS